MNKRKLTALFFFPVAIFVNVVSFVVISLYHQESQAGFYFTAWYQIAGLFEVFNNFGIDVIAGHTEFLPTPNVLGWFLVISNCSIVLIIFYIISKKLATLWINKSKNKM